MLATGFAGHRVPVAVERPAAAGAERFAPRGDGLPAEPPRPAAARADVVRTGGAGPDVVERPFVASDASAGGVRTGERTPPRRRGFPTRGTGLDWEGVHGAVDGMRWGADGPSPVPRGSPAAAGGTPRALHGVGFPGLEVVERLPPSRRRDWRALVAWRDAAHLPGTREPIPNVRCMGLSPAAVARRAARYEPLVVELAIEHGVSASLVNAVISVESCFDPTAVSPAGAFGLMQLMPATAAWLGAERPHDVRGNLDAGIRYLALLEERFADRTLALAAYNAGPGNVRRYGGVPPFAETRAYVGKVLAHHRRYAATARFVGELASAAGPAADAERPAADAAGRAAPSDVPPAGAAERSSDSG